MLVSHYTFVYHVHHYAPLFLIHYLSVITTKLFLEGWSMSNLEQRYVAHTALT